MFFQAGVHRFFFLFGVVSLGFGIMMGAVPTSVPQFILIINWLLEGNFTEKWQRLKSNPVFWALELIFFIHVFGMAYTSDLVAGIKDIQIKLPLLTIPLVIFSSRPLKEEEFRSVFIAFLAGCFVNTAWCLVYSFVLHADEPSRNTSRFMSHIRLGLYLNMALVICAGFFLKQKEKRVWPIVLALYFLVVIFVLGLATGLIISVLLTLVAGIYAIGKLGAKYKVLVLVVLFGSLFGLWKFVAMVKDEQLGFGRSEINRPLLQTAGGNYYLHFDTLGRKENGNYIQMNIQLEELQRTWNRRNPDDYFTYPPEAHNLNRYQILLRYLAGKGLPKDSVAVMSLTKEDIANIRNNVPNHLYNDWSNLHQRVYELVNEYDDLRVGRNVNGNSVTMRYYFWKAALYAIVHDPWSGSGTGDVGSRMWKAYVDSGSPLDQAWYKHPHNQFLSMAVAFGLPGLFLFLFSLIYPAVKLWRTLGFTYLAFACVYWLSFLTEDTLETQAGVTFFTFFTVFLLARAWIKRPQSPAGSQQLR